MNFLNEKNNFSFPSKTLNNKIVDKAQKLSIPLKQLIVHSHDIFYSTTPSIEEFIKVSGAKCVEMEANALFVIAKSLNKNAACLLTVSDNLITNENTTSEERQNAFENMMKIALELA